MKPIQYSDELEKKKLVPLGSVVGLIIPMKTGIVFTNQVDGTSCQHPELEGIFIPLLNYSYEDLNDIMKEYPTSSFIKKWIKKHNLPLKLLESKWRKGLGSYSKYPEAWINVKIIKTESNPLKDFVGMEAILTYENSD